MSHGLSITSELGSVDGAKLLAYRRRKNTDNKQMALLPIWTFQYWGVWAGCGGGAIPSHALIRLCGPIKKGDPISMIWLGVGWWWGASPHASTKEGGGGVPPSPPLCNKCIPPGRYKIKNLLISESVEQLMQNTLKQIKQQT